MRCEARSRSRFVPWFQAVKTRKRAAMPDEEDHAWRWLLLLVTAVFVVSAVALLALPVVEYLALKAHV
jgi:uncharacterized membrane-anchored protein